MKLSTKLIYGLNFLLTIFILSSCSQESKLDQTKVNQKEQTFLYKSVTNEEYLNATDLERRFIDQVDAAVNSIDILKKNNSTLDYEAIISIDKDSKNKLNNAIIIGLVDKSSDAISKKLSVAPDGKCHICGISSAYSCIKEVSAYMDSHNTNTITATVTRDSDGCVDIKYH